MKKRLLPKAAAAAMLYMGSFPVYMLPAGALLPGRVWLGALLPLPALLLSAGAGLLPPRRRAIGLLLGLAVMAALGFLLLYPISPLALLLLLPCALLMLLFLPAMARPAYEEWQMPLLGIGVGLHIAAQLVKSKALFAGLAAPLSIVFTVYLMACLFWANRMMLWSTGPGAIKTLLLRNRVLMTGLCLLALFFANIAAIGRALRAAILWIIAAVAKLLVWATSFLQPESPGSAPGGPMSLSGLAEPTEPSLLSRIMEIVFIVIAVVLVAVLLFFALRALWRLLRKALRALLLRLQLYRQRIAQDYSDESESLLRWDDLRSGAQARLRRLRQRFAPVRWDRLTPADRVRRVYALLLRRQKDADPARTAQEMLAGGALPMDKEAAQTLAALYDRARYSTHPISAQEADEARKSAGV